MLLLPVLLILLFLSHSFSGAETALMRLSKLQIRELKKKKKRKILSVWQEKPHRIITSILIGNNVVNIFFSSLFTYWFVTRFSRSEGDQFRWEMTAFLIVSFLILFFGEVLPKLLSSNFPAKLYLFYEKILQPSYSLLSPLVNFFTSMTEKLLSLKVEPEKTLITRQEIADLIHFSSEEMGLSRDVKKMMTGVFSLRDKKITKIMTPREKMVSLFLSDPVEKMMESIIENGYSRYPV
ncbi:MAG TPA: CNNM domain-containing protein, partial [bacterium]|nr:CNNM domain-containing protein [bacterium]